MMKIRKISALILTLIIGVLPLFSCSSSSSDALADSDSEPDVRNTEIQEEGSETETDSAASSPASVVTAVEYGENTGTSATLTGLEPLPLVDFVTSDPDNTAGLSTEKISHSYGVAENETANDISVNNQAYFDNGNFKALTLDTKTEEKIVYLTFDVGYDNGYTGQILDTLKEKSVTAAFFCTVSEMESDPDSIARMITEGHIVGNHTKNHPSMDEISRAEMTAEIKAFDDYIRTNFGYSSPYFRFPKGEYSDCALELVGSLGYTSVFWSLAYADWDLDDQKGADYALKTVVDRIHPGAVILLHAVSPDNAAALGDIIDTVRSMGYEFKSLEDYNA
ncbi:MAG: polysaccharide deacetylase family protein [Clostridiales bacterium]|nr:polysaccharide deacetylase family protein [Clostridiales bacterium]